ncbi:MAG: hypothetical protein MJZ66_09890 [Bacteroidales bacterium]|nr:hypothetical protein [Bacteroidales bacterium]MCQ2253663.1 hypothetical protein [Bacteroidales bacterium]
MKRFVLLLLIAFVGIQAAFSQKRVQVDPEISVVFPQNVSVYENYKQKTSASTRDGGFAISFFPQNFDKSRGQMLAKKLRDVAFNTMRMNRNPDNYFTDEVELDNAEGVVICGFDRDYEYCMASLIISDKTNKGCYIFSYFDEDYVDMLDEILDSIEFK